MTALVDLLPDAREEPTDHGDTVVVETRFPMAKRHAGVRPERLQGPVGPGLGVLAGADLAVEQELAEAVFLDVESTGLGAGAGTYAFLVGLARLADGEVILRQHFLRAPEDEAAFVNLLDRELTGCPLLVTFNGRSFDVPLLHTRFILQRKSLPVLSVPHLDLMRPARRLWRHHLASCALTSLEENLLGLHREGDIPGREIPALYLDYLGTGDATPLVPVVQHNATDVLSMLSLAVRIRALLDAERPRTPEPPAVWLGLGHCRELLGEPARAEQAYLEASADGAGEPRGPRDEALRRLSGLYKRAHQWDRAVDLWRTLVQQSHPHGVYPYEELAKHLEHREHGFEEALELVDTALFRLATGRLSCRREPHVVLKTLEHRRARLVRRGRREG